MPAHQNANAICNTLESNGKPSTAVEWRAKQGATRCIAVDYVVGLAVSTEALVKHSAAMLGVYIYASNNH